MTILNGWKEIANCLNRTTRCAQRWERLGLPVRRLSDSSRAPVVAFRHEIENWVRSKNARSRHSKAASPATQAACRETRRLLAKSKALLVEHQAVLVEYLTASLEHKGQLDVLRRSMARVDNSIAY